MLVSAIHVYMQYVYMCFLVCTLWRYMLCSLQLLLRFASFMIVAGIANYYVFIPVVIIVGVFLLVRWYYLTTAREIKRLEAVGESVWSMYCRYF